MSDKEEDTLIPKAVISSEDGVTSSTNLTEPTENHDESDVPNEAEAPQVQFAKTEEFIKSKLEESKGETKELGEDFFYDKETLIPPLTKSVSFKTYSFFHSFGVGSNLRNNVHMLNDTTLLFVSGFSVVIFNYVENSFQHVLGLTGKGIGAVAVHPSKQYFAVAEKGIMPNIYIYEYPSLRIYRILRKGTERSYSDLNFSSSGTKLASVGSFPDYMLTVWDWKSERIILRSKAFSQDVYRICFSSDDEGRLISSGTGHIKFWKMAHTFTGLKLQGMIGKFGSTQLSDVSAFVELPDGSVIAGTEYGTLLLWDGNLIKVEITRKRPRSCHEGMIEAIFFHDGQLITSGADGFVRTWDFTVLEGQEYDGDAPKCELEPLEEIAIGQGECSVKSMLWNERTSFLVSETGSIFSLDFESHVSEELHWFHAGSINSIDILGDSPHVVTGGEDGYLTVCDYSNKSLVYKQKFSSPATVITAAPQSVDPQNNVFAAGFADGIVRILSRCQDAFALLHIFKPHQGRVVSLEYAPDGVLIASASGSQVFFLNVQSGYSPIGFVDLEAEISFMNWKHDGSTLLVSTISNIIFELNVPAPQRDPNALTFELTLQKKKYLFKGIEPEVTETEGDNGGENAEDQVRRDAEMAQSLGITLVEAPVSRQPSQVIHKSASALLPSSMSLGNLPAGAAEALPPEEDAEKESRPVSILCAVYLPDATGQILVGAVGGVYDPLEHSPGNPCPPGEDAGLFICDLNSEFALSRVNGTEGKGFTYLGFSFAEQPLLLAGCTNGCVLVARVGSLAEHWTIQLHDMDLGQVNKVVTAPKDQYLLSCASDGSFFILAEESDDGIASSSAALNVPPLVTSSSIGSQVEDITDPSHYSIQEEKLKKEHDKRVAEAEAKKSVVLQKIDEIREDFFYLVRNNQKGPLYERLSRDEYRIDRDLQATIFEETETKKQQLRNELMWEFEKKKVALQKLRRKFLDPLACDHIVVHALDADWTISSYRCPKLPECIVDSVQAVHEMIKSRQPRPISAESTPSLDNKGVADELALASGDTSAEPSTENTMKNDEDALADSDSLLPKQPSAAEGESGAGENTTITKLEQRRRERAERANEWEKLVSANPLDEGDDPQDVEAIYWAKNNMGDYKLKTGADYVVPEEQRIDDVKKRIEMVIGEEAIFNMKMDFNERLLGLRDLKKRLVERISEMNSRLKTINRELDDDLNDGLFFPEEFEDEYPEKREEYSDEMLSAFLKKQQKEDRKAAKERHKGRGGVDLLDEVESEGSEDEGDAHRPPTPQGAGARAEEGGALETMGLRQRSTLKQMNEPLSIVSKSPLESMEDEKRAIVLRYEKERLIKEMHSSVQKFDTAVREMRGEKFKLDADLKSTELKMLLLYRELILLKEFKKKDVTLLEKLQTKRSEKAEMTAKLKEANTKLVARKTDAEKVAEKTQSVLTQFKELVPESDRFYDVLLKVFKKRVRKVARAAAEDEAVGSDQDSDLDSIASDESDESLSDSEGEDEEEVCPAGVEEGVFRKVCELRAQRLDCEDALLEVERAVALLKKDYETLLKKDRVLDAGLKQAQHDIAAFQTVKQQRLNELDVGLMLRMDQVQCLVDGKLPQDLSEKIVFTLDNKDRLTRRIKELMAENKALHRNLIGLKKEIVSDTREKRARQAKITELEDRAYDVQMLKFGQAIDLEALERMSVNKAADDMKARIQTQEQNRVIEVEKAKKAISRIKEQLAQETLHNTQLLKEFATLTRSQTSLETALNTSQSAVVPEYCGDKREELQKQKMKKTISENQQKIDSLRAEIALLSTKTGMILPPQ